MKLVNWKTTKEKETAIFKQILTKAKKEKVILALSDFYTEEEKEKNIQKKETTKEIDRDTIYKEFIEAVNEGKFPWFYSEKEKNELHKIGNFFKDRATDPEKSIQPANLRTIKTNNTDMCMYLESSLSIPPARLDNLKRRYALLEKALIKWTYEDKSGKIENCSIEELVFNRCLEQILIPLVDNVTQKKMQEKNPDKTITVTTRKTSIIDDRRGGVDCIMEIHSKDKITNEEKRQLLLIDLTLSTDKRIIAEKRGKDQNKEEETKYLIETSLHIANTLKTDIPLYKYKNRTIDKEWVSQKTKLCVAIDPLFAYTFFQDAITKVKNGENISLNISELKKKYETLATGKKKNFEAMVANITKPLSKLLEAA